MTSCVEFTLITLRFLLMFRPDYVRPIDAGDMMEMKVLLPTQKEDGEKVSY